VFCAATAAEDIEDLQLLQLRVGEFNEVIDEAVADEAMGDEIEVMADENQESTVPSIDGTCDFEGSLCGWVQSKSDQFDWSFRSGKTPSSNTGPTKAFKGSQYLFIEASNPRKFHDKAILSGTIYVKANSALSFKYSMYGSTMGILEVLIDGSSVFKKEGDLKFADWQDANIDLSGYAGKTVDIQIVGVRGSSWSGDLAIDDVAVTSSASAAGGGNLVDATCDFEGSLSGWSQANGDQFDWSFRKGASPSSGTGPTKAFKGSQYLFIEASNPRKPGDTAILSGDVQVVAGTSLKFAYSMLGQTIGTLKVQVDGDEVFSKSGDLKTAAWQDANIDLSKYAGKTVNVQISGVRGSSWSGDIAIDGLAIESPTATTSAPVVTVDATCDFEGSLCGWEQAKNVDQFDWSFRAGTTPSSGTGPTKAFKGNQYLYIEASSPRKKNDMAILLGSIQVKAGTILSFAYSMFGPAIGSLAVKVDTKVVWIKSGTLKTAAWERANIDLSENAGKTVKVGIIAARGSSWGGDIAIDDLAVGTGAATTPTTATTTTVKLSDAVDGVYDNQRTKTASKNIVGFHTNVATINKCLCLAKRSTAANSKIVAVNYQKSSQRCIMLQDVSVSNGREGPMSDWSTAVVKDCKKDMVSYDVPKNCSGLTGFKAVKCNKLLSVAGYTSGGWINAKKCMIQVSTKNKMYDWGKAKDYCITGNTYCNGVAKKTVKSPTTGKYINEFTFCKAWYGQFSMDDLPATWPYGGVMEVKRKDKVLLPDDEFDSIR